MRARKRTRAEIEGEKREKVDTIRGHVERLARLTDEAAAGQEIGGFLRFLGRFHTYSAGNALLIRLQKPEATWVAGYSGWQRLGRWPKKGSGLKIFAPTLKAVAMEEGGDGDKEEQPISQLCGFHLATVFDVSDTEGEALPPVANYWREEAEEGEGLYRGLQAAAEEMGIVVEETHLGLTGGVSYGGRVAVNVDNPLLARTSSLAHELAHELLHQRDPGEERDRRTREVEAEAAAYVVCAHFGYEVKAPQYIALWQGDAEGIMARLETIRRAASAIIGQVEKQLSADEEASQTAADPHIPGQPVPA